MIKTRKIIYVTLLLLSTLVSFWVGSTRNQNTAEARNNTFKTCKTSVYYVHSKKDLKKLDKALTKRNGKIIVEIINGIVQDKKGNGVDSAGYYIYYDPQKFKKGNKVQTVLVYNPETNSTDDILYRIDTLVD